MAYISDYSCSEKAQIQLPGERAGKIMLQELARLAPHAEVGKPNDSAKTQ